MNANRMSSSRVIQFAKGVWRNIVHHGATATRGFKPIARLLKTIWSRKLYISVSTSVMIALVLFTAILVQFPDFVLSIWRWLRMRGDVNYFEMVRNIVLFVGGSFALYIAYWRSFHAIRQQKMDEHERLDEWVQNGSDWSRKPYISVSVGVTIALGLLTAILVQLPDFILSIWRWLRMGGDINNSELARNIFLFVGGPFALYIAYWRSHTANRQQKADARARLDERFQKGSEMLGSNQFVVRMSGITILERLSSEHPKEFHIQVINLLGKFIKHPEREDTRLEGADLQEALMAIGRRGEQGISEHSRRVLDISRSNFNGVKLKYCDFIKVDFLRSTFKKKARILHSKFRKSRLRHVKFDETYFANVVFLRSTLGHASFVSAKLQRVRFINSGLSEANFTDTVFVKGRFKNSVAHGAVFVNANLSEAVFSETHLNLANFFNANLTNANFTQSSLIGANLRDADLKLADLTDVDLSMAKLKNVKNLTQSQLDVACQSLSSPPQLDEGFSWDKEAALERYRVSRESV